MRHLVLIGALLLGLASGMSLTWRCLHHGVTFEYQEMPADAKIAALGEEEKEKIVQPQEMIFGGEVAFNHLYPDIRKTEDPDKIFASGREIQKDWIVYTVDGRDWDKETRVQRIYWDKKYYWISLDSHIDANDYIVAIGDSAYVVSSELNPDQEAKPEPILGRDYFGKRYPDLIKADEPSELFSSDSRISTAWIVNSDPCFYRSATKIKKVYWNETHYYFSETWHLNNDGYAVGEKFVKVKKGWDDIRGDNWPMAVFALMLPEFLFAIIVFGLAESLFTEDDDYYV